MYKGFVWGIIALQERWLVRESIEHELRCMGKPTGAQKITMIMGRVDVDVSGRSDYCANAPNKYHKPGAIHFTNKARTEFIRGCRYCEWVMDYRIETEPSGSLRSTRKTDTDSAKSQTQTDASASNDGK